MAQTPTIDRLLNLVPDSPDSVLHQLQQHPELATKQDSHGYSLLHAASSYGHIDLAKALVEDFNVNPNITDEDGETCLFNAEMVEVAKELVEMGVDMNLRNNEGQTAAEKLDDEDEQPMIAQFLRTAARENSIGSAASVVTQTGGASDSTTARAGTVNGDEPHTFPPMPNGVQIDVGTMQADEAGEAPDPEFRRRIEELAARSDFEGEAGQRELRDLISDAVSGISQDGQGAASRRRLG